MALKTSNLEHAMLVHPEAMSVGALADKIRKIENWPQNRKLAAKRHLIPRHHARPAKRGILPTFG